LQAGRIAYVDDAVFLVVVSSVDDLDVPGRAREETGSTHDRLLFRRTSRRDEDLRGRAALGERQVVHAVRVAFHLSNRGRDLRVRSNFLVVLRIEKWHISIRSDDSVPVESVPELSVFVVELDPVATLIVVSAAAALAALALAATAATAVVAPSIPAQFPRSELSHPSCLIGRGVRLATGPSFDPNAANVVFLIPFRC